MNTNHPVKGSAGVPNIVLILMDDIGFADPSTFGGVAQTPELDHLAAHGLKYNNFHTAGSCAPTRAALLSGRNQHRVGFGLFPETPGKTAGYDTMWRKSTASIAAVLRQNGYSTAAFGKWHNTPDNEITPCGPFDRWPTGLGFEYFYGFLNGAQSQWEPAWLYRNTTPVEPEVSPEQGYHLTTDLTDEAILWLQTHESAAPTKPYFLYFATGAVHYPHHVAKQWIDHYRGKFDQGWDWFREQTFARQKQLGVIPAQARLTPRPKEIPGWTSLSTDETKLYVRVMEIYAGFIEHTDHELGRLIQAIRQGPRADNTAIFFIVGDNGGSPYGMMINPETVKDQLRHIDQLGGPRYINGLPYGWAWAASTPFQWHKGVASHFGAVRNPLVVSWPARIRDGGGSRTQFTHVNDIAATFFDIADVDFPTVVSGEKQLPLDGVSFASTLDDSAAPSNHRVQYFEVRGNRSIYQDGWVAAARHDWAQMGEDFSRDRWELYHVAEDYSEADDLAARYPDKLAELQALFDREARKNDVYPLGGAGPLYSSPVSTAVYRSGFPRIIPMNAPQFSKSHLISAQLTVPADGAQGVIVSYGSRWGGFALYAKDGRMVYEAKVDGKPGGLITSNVPLPHGNVNVSYEFVVDAGAVDLASPTGTGRLYFDRRLVGESRVRMDDWWGAFWGSFGIGKAFGSPVSDAFRPPFEFTGTLEKVTVTVL